MIYFIHGEDSYRSKRKLEEIVLGYKKKHKSGLNLIYIDAVAKDFKEFYSNLKTNSMFAEKKLIVLKNVFSAKGGLALSWQEEFLENIKNLESIEDIIIVYEDCSVDKRLKLFKALTKAVLAGQAKCQEFNYLDPAMLRKWVVEEFAGNPSAGSGQAKIEPSALDLLVAFVGSDLWRMANEIKKLSDYVSTIDNKKNVIINKDNVELLVRPSIENDIFKTIEAISSKNKKLALNLLHKHFDEGEAPLRLLSMIAYQFKNLLIIKELQDANQPYGAIVKKSGLHPFVVQKTSYLCSYFTIEKLKKIYQKIFQIDLDIKMGKIEPEIALDLLVAEI